MHFHQANFNVKADVGFKWVFRTFNVFILSDDSNKRFFSRSLKLVQMHREIFTLKFPFEWFGLFLKKGIVPNLKTNFTRPACCRNGVTDLVPTLPVYSCAQTGSW